MSFHQLDCLASFTNSPFSSSFQHLFCFRKGDHSYDSSIPEDCASCRLLLAVEAKMQSQRPFQRNHIWHFQSKIPADHGASAVHERNRGVTKRTITVGANDHQHTAQFNHTSYETFVVRVGFEPGKESITETALVPVVVYGLRWLAHDVEDGHTQSEQGEDHSCGCQQGMILVELEWKFHFIS